MYVRSVLLIGTTVVGMLSASDAQAGLFGKRKCCQETPVVCPQACCSVAIVASHPIQSVICQPQVNQCSPQTAPPISQAMIMESFEETYTVQVPYTETIIGPDGKPRTITRIQQETKTRTVQKAVPANEVIADLRRQLEKLKGSDDAQNFKLGENDKTDTKQADEIKKLTDIVAPPK